MAEKRHASEEARQEEKPAEVNAEPKPEVKQEKMEGRRQEDRRRQESPSSSETPSIEGYRREREPARERKARRDDNVVYVGKKPTMSYVLAVITQFSEGNNEVFVKARGRSISRAVDVIEVVKKKFMQDVKCEMDTDTEVITDERNQRINVSTFSGKLFK